MNDAIGSVDPATLDLLVYHRLLDACFIEGLFLEDRYPLLPPLRHNMMVFLSDCCHALDTCIDYD